MSRTALCVLTAVLLAAASAATMAARRSVLGDALRRPSGPNTWKVRMVVRGTYSPGGRLLTATPLELERQRVLDDSYASPQLQHKAPQARHPERREVLWTAWDLAVSGGGR